jgi:hypothetical protein
MYIVTLVIAFRYKYICEFIANLIIFMANQVTNNAQATT